MKTDPPGADDRRTTADDPAVAALSYTEASRELDQIVEFFEQRDVDVDQLVARLERATALIEELDRRLRQTRMQVEQLVPRLSTVLAEPTGATGDTGGEAQADAGGDAPERIPASKAQAARRPSASSGGDPGEPAAAEAGSGHPDPGGARWRSSRPGGSEGNDGRDATPELF